MNAAELVAYHGQLAVEFARLPVEGALQQMQFHASCARAGAVLGARSRALEKIEAAHKRAHEGFLNEEELCLEVEHALEDLKAEVGNG